MWQWSRVIEPKWGQRRTLVCVNYSQMLGVHVTHRTNSAGNGRERSDARRPGVRRSGVQRPGVRKPSVWRPDAIEKNTVPPYSIYIQAERLNLEPPILWLSERRSVSYILSDIHISRASGRSKLRPGILVTNRVQAQVLWLDCMARVLQEKDYIWKRERERERNTAFCIRGIAYSLDTEVTGAVLK